MQFEFATATRVIFGRGTARTAGGLAKEFGRMALVVTGRDTGRAQSLADMLKGGGIGATLFAVAGEPRIDTVRDGVRRAREEKCDVVIGFGGGSALDSGKAIAAMLTNPGDVLDYLEIVGAGKKLGAPPAPFIAMPTTAGTGSEVTRNAVLASPERRLKASLRSPLMLPRVALVNPELTYTSPPFVTATTGMDALTQLIEPYVSCRANPMTDALCLEGMRRAARSLRPAFLNGGNTEAREDMCVASLFGGMALSNAGLGAVHGFAGVIGGMFEAPHGAVCAALLPHVMEGNLLALRKRAPQNPALGRYETIARLLTGNARAAAQDGIEWVRCLVGELRIPSLSAYGLSEADSGAVIEKSSKASSMKANPLVLVHEELGGILRREQEGH